MSDGPEVIVDAPDVVFVLTAAAHTLREKPRYGHCTQYRRADIPATDAQAMANPKVQALVDIMPEVLASLDASGWNVSLARDVRAAIAALEADT